MTKKKSSASDSGSRPAASTSKRADGIPPHRLHLWQVQAIRDVLVIAGGIFVVLTGYWLRSVTVPLLIALALAYLFEPLVNALSEKWKWSRQKVVGGIIACLALVVIVVMTIVVPLMISQTVQFASSIGPNLKRIVGTAQSLDPRVRQPIENALGVDFENIYKMLDKPQANSSTDDGDSGTIDDAQSTTKPGEPRSDHEDHEKSGDAPALTDQIGQPGLSADRTENDNADQETAKSKEPDELSEQSESDAENASRQKIEAWLKQNLSSILQFTVKTTGDAVSVIGRLVGSAIYVAFLLFLIPFYFYFFSTAWPKGRRFIRETLPPEHFRDEYELVDKMDHAISGFVRGRIVISAIMGVLLAIGWGFCGVPYWLIVGLSTGVLCAVPYLGGIGIPVAIILLWLGQGEYPADERMAWWGIIFWPSLVFSIVQLIEGYILTPYIAGKATNLGPVSILVAVLAGGVVAGVYGMLLAIPVMACLKILMTDILLPRIHLWARGQAEDILPIDER